MKKEDLLPSLGLDLSGLMEFVAASRVPDLTSKVIFSTMGVLCFYFSEKMLEQDPIYYVKSCNVSDWINRYMPIH